MQKHTREFQWVKNKRGNERAGIFMLLVAGTTAPELREHGARAEMEH